MVAVPLQTRMSFAYGPSHGPYQSSKFLKQRAELKQHRSHTLRSFIYREYDENYYAW